MRVQSGDHAGCDSSTSPGERVERQVHEVDPSVFITQMSPMRRVRKLRNAIRVPSGDQAGWSSISLSNVEAAGGPVPSRFTTEMYAGRALVVRDHERDPAPVGRTASGR